MSQHDVFMTKEGLELLKKELGELKTVRRKEVAGRVESAKEYGDLSENAEYVEAKNEQAFVEGRIAELEMIIKNAVLIDEQRSSSRVQVGSSVTVETKEGNEQTFVIVGSNEADPGGGRISNASPLGQAFLGKKVGDLVEIVVPRGKTSYRIKRIK